MKRRRTGFTLIELLIVMVLIGILAVIAQAFLWKAKDRALISTITTDIKNLATQQESYFGANYQYAPAPSDITSYVSSPGVVLTITYANIDGWAVTGTHPSVVGSQCGYFVGNATPADAPPATLPGVVECN